MSTTALNYLIRLQFAICNLQFASLFDRQNARAADLVLLQSRLAHGWRRPADKLWCGDGWGWRRPRPTVRGRRRGYCRSPSGCRARKIRTAGNPSGNGRHVDAGQRQRAAFLQRFQGGRDQFAGRGEYDRAIDLDRHLPGVLAHPGGAHLPGQLPMLFAARDHVHRRSRDAWRSALPRGPTSRTHRCPTCRRAAIDSV